MFYWFYTGKLQHENESIWIVVLIFTKKKSEMLVKIEGYAL